jgi:hypothetical protein
MIRHDLEKAWAARAPLGLIYRAPTFDGDRLMLGAETEIAVARKAELNGSASSREHDARMVALLSVFYGGPVSDRALAHLRRSLEKRGEGDALLASTHLALVGHWPLRDPAPAAKRIFICDKLMKSGTAPETILAALGLDPRPDLLKRNVEGERRNPPGDGVESGRWTRGGDGPGKNEAVIGGEAAADDDSLFSEKLPASVLQSLFRLATRSSIPWIAFETLFVPSADKSGVTEGVVPGRPDLRYNWDKPSGQVVFRVFIDGHWVTLTGGRDNLNQFYRDADGNVIARAVKDALIVDLGALDHAREQLTEASGGQPQQKSSSNDGGGPKLCPEPSGESNKGWSANSSAYQRYVSGLGAGLAVLLNGVSFDGCDPSTGFMLEGKGNYAFFVNPDGTWKLDYLKPDGTWKAGLGENSFSSIRSQMVRQSDAAALDGRMVEWHVQQKPVADVFEGWVKELGLPNIEVMYDPGPRR